MEELIVLLIYLKGSKTVCNHYWSISDMTYKIRFETHLSVLIPCVDIIEGGRFSLLVNIIKFWDKKWQYSS